MTRGHARFLLCVGLATLVGCGARTESFSDEGYAVGGQGHGGASAGATSGGAPNPNGGAPPVNGGASFGGNGVSGSFGAFGGVGIAGTPSGGFGAVGGVPVAGAGGSFGGAAGEGGSGATGGIVEACLSVANSSCDQCLCMNCAPQVDGCFSDLGCTLIFACTQQTGCQGLACYSPSTCRPIIDQFGGLSGGSMARVFGLLSCAVASQGLCGCN